MTCKRTFIIAILTFQAIFLNAGCKRDISPLDDFAKVPDLVLKGEEIDLSGDTVLYSLGNFQVLDTLGIFNDNVGKSTYSIVNLRTGKLLKRFIYGGDGPTEFDVNSVSLNWSAYDSRVFSVLQANPPCRIVRYNLDSLLTKPDYQPAPLFYPKKFGYVNCWLLDDSTIFGQISYSQFDTKMYGITNLSSKKLLTGMDVPSSDNRSDQAYYSDSLYYKVLKNLLNLKVRLRPESNFEFASFSKNGAVIQIFELDKAGSFKVNFEKVYYLPSFNIVSGGGLIKPNTNPDSKWGFNDLAVTKEKIYALFNGPELTNAPSETHEILVYNWRGKPGQRLKLDRNCFSIAIDAKDPHLLYGLYGNDVIHLVRYKLP